MKKALLLFAFTIFLSCTKKNYSKTQSGILYSRGKDSIEVKVLSENILRITHFNKNIQNQISQIPFILPIKNNVKWAIKSNRKSIEISTVKLKAKITKKGKVFFYDSLGKELVSELISEPSINKQVFTNGEEAIYGLGQFQNGLMNLKNVPLRLKQFNQEIANPFMVSTKGYGILWNNTSITDFNWPENKLKFTQTIDSTLNIRKTNFVAQESGTYYFTIESLNKKENRFAGPVLLTFDKDTVIHYNTTWVPEVHSGNIFLKKGKSYEVIFTNANSQVLGDVFYNAPNNSKTTFQSNYGNGVDYYYVGGTPSEAIASYRQLTGESPMFDKSVFGFWQCRERYHSQEELLENAMEYRKRNIPIDNIVLDWNYWPNNTWGPEWNKVLFPNSKKMSSDLKDLNLNLMVSVWPKITNPKLEKIYDLGKHKIDKSGNLDFFNPEVQKNYYQMVKDSMFNLGVRSIWLDGTEPEDQPLGASTHLGLFDHNALAYSFMVTKAVYNGYRQDFPDKRVFNLTRSAFAGQQRFGAAVWSGDVLASWEQFQEQITAGLNISMSGLPYWTTDIGGFFRDSNSFNPKYDNQYTNEDFKELMTRWFQFGTFCPLFRIHGYVSNTEIWRYGKPFENTARNFIDLRYQLMPYIYATASKVTTHGATIIKPLAHDYPEDEKCWDIKNQFLFGNNLMICPVVEKGARKRNVYLPKGNWVDFWTGKTHHGENLIIADAPLERLPLFVKEGAIIPIGPKIQYTMQNNSEPLKILIYTGTNGKFELYEDEGENYNYVEGKSSSIVFDWNEAEQKLIIGNRSGSFTGMKNTRNFKILLAKQGFENIENEKVKNVSYDGTKIEVRF